MQQKSKYLFPQQQILCSQTLWVSNIWQSHKTSVKAETEKNPASNRASKYFLSWAVSPNPKGRVATSQLRFQFKKNLPDSLLDKSFGKERTSNEYSSSLYLLLALPLLDLSSIICLYTTKQKTSRSMFLRNHPN